MNAVINQPQCACCQEKSREIADMQSAFAQEVSSLMDTILQQKETIAAQETMLRFADARINRHVAHHGEQHERRMFRGATEAAKIAASGLPRLTERQAVIISGYTGYTACRFDALQEDVSRRLDRPVLTHEFGSDEFAEKVHDLYRADFAALCAEGTPEAGVAR